jgi:Domain of unknown function (DUF5060)/Domain of unknown function (DUF5605)/Protein of unknown function (DUF4038)
MSLRKTSLILIGLLLVVSVCGAEEKATVGQWGVFELTLKGPAAGNPFLEVTLSGHFTHGGKSVDANGFYDGDGVYRVRFMPEEQGEWTYETKSNVVELNGKSGEFVCGAPVAGNHGPVRVRNHFHFAYADGTPYFEIGTTAYNWTNQTEAREQQTLETLKTGPFNKVRMCVLPSEYVAATTGPATQPLNNHPTLFAFEGKPMKDWDFNHFSPAFFHNLENCVKELGDEGIEADVILLHPYNKKMGFANMPAEVDDRYVRYVVARLAAYHNVWWSLANEYDMMHAKKEADWDRLGEIVQKDDPYDHLRSIQQSHLIYNKAWVTHASIQAGGTVAVFGGAIKTREQYDKPIIFDEIQYEGDIPKNWGRLSGVDMVHRFWTGTVNGTYVGHGETFHDGPWSSSGGVLIGQSPARLGFLRKILETSPAEGIEPIENSNDDRVGGKAGEYYLLYFGKETPTEWAFELPSAKLAAGTKMHVDVIDAWNMTITPVDQVFTVVKHDEATVRAEGDAKVKLPGNALMALRITTIH